MTFKNLNLAPEILKAVEDSGYTTPTPIQEQAIPIVLAGQDLRGSAQTGTGKTAAFILPSLNLLTKPSSVRGFGPRILVLVPTRELAIQVAAEAAKYSKFMSKTKTVCIYGGVPYPIQNRELSRPYEILVATPGRLIDQYKEGRIDFSRIEMFILDEADRMLDMGFIDPVMEIAAAMPKERQTLMFSATFNDNVLSLSKRLLNNPVEVKAEFDLTTHDNIDQSLLYADSIGHKHQLLDHLLTNLPLDQAIIFTATKFHADQLVDKLFENGHRAAALHGDMNQRQRTKTITLLRQGKIKILVATDVAARGIDIPTISHVINFDLPAKADDYVHRIGRTGRAGAKGTALSFTTAKDMKVVKEIEMLTGQKMLCQVIPGMEPKFSGQSNKPRRPSPRGPQQKNFRSRPRY